MGTSGGVAAAVGTAVPGVLLILIGCFAPLALFKMLAFVDPGTSSGAAMRTGLAAQGGIAGPAARRNAAAATSGAASSTDANGRRAGEDASADATTPVSPAPPAGSCGALGPVGQAAPPRWAWPGTVRDARGAVGADLSNQMGVGHRNYVPDFATNRGRDGAGPGPGQPRELDPTTDTEAPNPDTGRRWTRWGRNPRRAHTQPPPGTSAGPGLGPAPVVGVAAAGGAVSGDLSFVSSRPSMRNSTSRPFPAKSTTASARNRNPRANTVQGASCISAKARALPMCGSIASAARSASAIAEAEGTKPRGG